ncbi:MAG: competence/damage-inducible protein A [Ignavibacteriae bacterium]|nr:competence/damage-inducible protein A [Ignavibacteriota bacterium]
MNCSILTIGDELLIGQVVNTNAAYISRQLNTIGIDVVRMVTIGDEEQVMRSAIQESFARVDLTIVTGGLGPTHDDITKKVLCNFFQTELVRSEEVIEDINHLLQRRNLVWSAATETQALVPKSAQIIRNNNGTAPGLFFEQNEHYLIAMPGVPFEMEAMMQDFVVPLFKSKSKKFILHRTLNTTGIGEAVLFEKLGNLKELLDNVKLAFLPSPSGTRLRLSIIETTQESAERQIKQAEENIRAKTDEYIYGVENETMADAIGTLLKEKQLTISTAESCTGGYIANQITNVSGSSEYFERGIITYSNRSKMELLDVPKEMLEQHGSVSKEVAEAMASGVRTKTGTDIGISTTGIAGPTGGTPEKPLGLVFIGYSDKKMTLALKFHFGDNRLRFKERTAQAALNLLRKKLLQHD